MSKKSLGRPPLLKDTEKREKLRVTVPMNKAEKTEIAEAVKAVSAEYGMPVAEAVWARKILLEAARAVTGKTKAKK